MKRRDFVVTGSLAVASLAFGAAAQSRKEYVCPPCGCSHDGIAHDAHKIGLGSQQYLIEFAKDYIEKNKRK